MPLDHSKSPRSATQRPPPSLPTGSRPTSCPSRIDPRRWRKPFAPWSRAAESCWREPIAAGLILKDELSEVAHVEQVAVYRNVDASSIPDAVLDRLQEGTVDWITLTSSAMAERLHALLPAQADDRIERREIHLAALSPVTASAARALGWPVSVEASEFTWPGLVAALCDFVKARRT